MIAFLTGSHIYGTPNEDSDVDLVLLTDIETLKLLWRLADDVDDNSGGGDGSCDASIRFGKLNLICLTEPKDYEAWAKGTKDLEARKPVTREEACETFHNLLNPQLDPTELF